jgi:hypothetical protein
MTLELAFSSKIKKKTTLEKSGPILILLSNKNNHKNPSQNIFKTNKFR